MMLKVVCPHCGHYGRYLLDEQSSLNVFGCDKCKRAVPVRMMEPTGPLFLAFRDIDGRRLVRAGLGRKHV